jgi:hypothetical protein
VDNLVRMADEALGQAKAAGRDCAVHVVLGADAP